MIKDLQASQSRKAKDRSNVQSAGISQEEVESLEREIEGLTTLLIESKKLHELKQSSAYSQIKTLEDQIKQLTEGQPNNVLGMSPRRRKLADFSRTLDLFMTVKSQTLDELEKLQQEMLMEQDFLVSLGPGQLLAKMQSLTDQVWPANNLSSENQTQKEHIKKLILRLGKLTRMDSNKGDQPQTPGENDEVDREVTPAEQLNEVVRRVELILPPLERMKIPHHLKEAVDQIEYIDSLIEKMAPSDKEAAAHITDEVYSLIQRFAPQNSDPGNEGFEAIPRNSYSRPTEGGGQYTPIKTTGSRQSTPQNLRSLEDEKVRLLEALEKKKQTKSSAPDQGNSKNPHGSPIQSTNKEGSRHPKSPLAARDENHAGMSFRAAREMHLESTPHAGRGDKGFTTPHQTHGGVTLVDAAPYMKIIEQYERQALKDRKWIEDLKKEIEDRVGNVLVTQQENESLKKHNQALRKKLATLEEDLKSYSSRWSEPRDPSAVREFKVEGTGVKTDKHAKPNLTEGRKPETRKSEDDRLVGDSPIRTADPNISGTLRREYNSDEDKKNKKLILKLERGLSKVLETASGLLQLGLQTHPAHHNIPRKADLLERMVSTLMAMIFERRSEGQFGHQASEERRLPSKEQLDRKDVRKASLSPAPETSTVTNPKVHSRPDQKTSETLQDTESKDPHTKELQDRLSEFVKNICRKSERMGELQKANLMMDHRVKGILDKFSHKQEDPSSGIGATRRRSGTGTAERANQLMSLEEFIQNSPLPSFTPRLAKQTQRAFEALEDILSSYSKYTRQLKEVTVDRKDLLEKILLEVS